MKDNFRTLLIYFKFEPVKSVSAKLLREPYLGDENEVQNRINNEMWRQRFDYYFLYENLTLISLGFSDIN